MRPTTINHGNINHKVGAYMVIALMSIATKLIACIADKIHTFLILKNYNELLEIKTPI